MKLTSEQIEDIVEQYIQEGLEGIDDPLPKHPLTPESIHNRLEGAADVRSMAHEDLITFNYNAVSATANGFLVQRNIEPDIESHEYRLLCHELLKARVGLQDVEVAKAKGDYGFTFPYENVGFPKKETPAPKAPQAFKPQSPSPTMGDLVKAWKAECTKADIWKPRTEKQYTGHFTIILQIIGADTPIRSIDHGTVRHIKDTLLKLPAGMNKKGEFQDKTVPEILEINESKGHTTLSVNTINGYLTTLGAFFKWCVGNGHMDMNYADGAKIRVRRTRRPDEIRKAFSTADLSVLFGSEEYKHDAFKESYQFWLPILGLYTGARINELCQLRLDDIQEVDGIPALVLQEDPNDKEVSIKNAASARIVPLHPFITEGLNFMGHVQAMRTKGEIRLFPELPYQNHNYGHKATKWFGTFKKKCGLDSKQLVFHSFRHTLSDNLKQQLITETLIDELTGHAIQGETMGRYGKRYSVEVLYREAVLKLDYKLDLGHLKNSKWSMK